MYKKTKNGMEKRSITKQKRQQREHTNTHCSIDSINYPGKKERCQREDKRNKERGKRESMPENRRNPRCGCSCGFK
ncbi:hypothetical protein BDQ17DRAFT_872421 [Cyathus striatus]|nr:hypothetical protein BDQ17DRAFT_872421 [Cyathus striatus]